MHIEAPRSGIHTQRSSGEDNLLREDGRRARSHRVQVVATVLCEKSFSALWSYFASGQTQHDMGGADSRLAKVVERVHALEEGA